MRRSKLTYSLLGTTAALALLAGCSSSGSSSSATGGSSSGTGVVNAASCPASASQAISGDTIVIGTTDALSGPYAILGQNTSALEALAKHIDAAGGLATADGKKQIKVVALDDQYQPARALANARQLVEQDHANVVVTVGSGTSSAAAPYLNQMCVPQLFPVGSSSALLTAKYPFTAVLDSYSREGDALGGALVKKWPTATVAALYEDGDYGNAYLAGLKSGVQGSSAKLVTSQSFEDTDTTVTSQLTTLIASKATDFALFATGSICTQALNAIASSSWRPRIWVGTTCGAQDLGAATQTGTTAGMYQVTFLKPLTGTDTDQKQFASILSADGVRPSNPAALGYTDAEVMFEAISTAKTLTPVGIMDAAHALTGNPPGMFATGVKLATALGTPALSTYAIYQWTATAKGFTSEFTTQQASGQ
jgi:branched-chain amino acid transport system substrate-binding protein